MAVDLSLIFSKWKISTPVIRKYALLKRLVTLQVTTCTLSGLATWSDGPFHPSDSIKGLLRCSGLALRFMDHRHKHTISRMHWNMDSARIPYMLLRGTRRLPRSHTLAQTPQANVCSFTIVVIA